MVREEEDVSRVMSNYGQLLADRAAGEAARSAAASPAPSPTMQPPGMLSGRLPSLNPFWGFLIYGGTPVHHPFLDGIFPNKTIHCWVPPMTMETSILGI